MKKYLDMALVSSLGLLAGLLIWNALFTWKVNYSINQIINTEKVEASKSFPIQLVEQNKDKINPVYYLSPTKKGTSVYQSLLLDQNALPNNKKNPQLTLVYPVAKATQLKNVKEVTVKQVSYDIGAFGVKNRQEKDLDNYQINGENQLFQLDQLFTDSTTGMERLNEELAILYPETEMTVSKLDKFSYHKGNLNFTDGRKLPLKNLYDIINSNYLNEQDLAAYQQYQKENRVFTEKIVALTFDDGPNAELTAKTLDLLEKYKAKATFFLVGKNIAGNEKLLKRMKKLGNEIGNHSWDHSNLSQMTFEQIKASVDETSNAVKDVVGEGTKLVRPPYGSDNDLVKAALKLPPVMWTIDTYDWQNRNPSMILENVKNGLEPGSVILMHDIHQTTIEALPAVLDYLTEQGYKFVTISELYGY
ncbi:polysaccharide deacetylase family protein [Streptococcus sp. sy004]|uniref:polysaccharide deacetylase family protein n=1 Tax=Streptococcus sp. sy004 TaxID=2600149 RepID=UPI0011B85D43|nr:polysaccharide deacetylase family protein [Streptococcus sp. sy004]TWT12270.1 polysaccharide deacetylase family protein [Streptococcus sp. sy004]